MEIEAGEQPTVTDVIVGVAVEVPPPPLPPPQAVIKRGTARIIKRQNRVYLRAVINPSGRQSVKSAASSYQVPTAHDLDAEKCLAYNCPKRAVGKAVHFPMPQRSRGPLSSCFLVGIVARFAGNALGVNIEGPHPIVLFERRARATPCLFAHASKHTPGPVIDFNLTIPPIAVGQLRSEKIVLYGGG